jgi:hypothetical protein
MRLDASRIPLVLTCAVACLSASPAPSVAQYRRESSVWAPRSAVKATTIPPGPQPLAPRIQHTYDPGFAGAVTALAGYAGVPGGAVVGWYLGYIACTATSSGDDTDFFGLPECFVADNDGFVYGALGGSFVMTYAVADHFGQRAGCDSRSAQKRAALGALLGTVPSAIYTVLTPAATRPTRIAVWSAPLLQAIGATVAVARCRRG